MMTSVRLLLVHPDPSLVEKATRAGLDVLVLAEGDPGRPGPETAAAIRRHIGEHGVTHVLDGEGFPLRSAAAAPGTEPFIRDLIPGAPTGGERATGPEIVASTLTVDGMHRVVGLTERITHGETTTYLYPAALPETRAARVRAAVTSMLDLYGYEFGPAQTRVALTGPEPRVLHSRPCFSIGRIGDLIEIAAGFDLRTELFRTLAGAALQPPRPRWFAGAQVLPEHSPEETEHSPEKAVIVEGPSAEDVRARLAVPPA